MALEALVRAISDRFRGRNVLHYLDVPSLAIVANVEEAERLKRTYSKRQLIVLHDPEYFSSRFCEDLPYIRLGGRAIEGVLFSGDRVGKALVQLYEREKNKDVAAESLVALDEAVAREAARREENKVYMAQVAQSFEGATSDSEQIRTLIGEILTSQFEYQEHFIRELYQNSSAATYGIEGGKIDIYLDPENRIIRFEDNGIGMSRDTMENVYFNLYKSINEALEHAAGKFGIGAVSIFGLGHEYVSVDSFPLSGQPGRAIVNANLERDDFLPSLRTSPGTSIEIKLSPDSTVDFKKIVDLLVEDCSYGETPTYIHQNGSVIQINQSLKPDVPNAIVFDNGKVSGHVVRTDVGEVKLLSHRIRLTSMPAIGFKGVANYDQLDTTFSRDTVTDDPALSYVLRFVYDNARRLKRTSDVDMRTASLEARIADYGDFLRKSLFTKEGVENDEWLHKNLADIVYLSNKRYDLFEEKKSSSLEFFERIFDLIGAFYEGVAKTAYPLKRRFTDNDDGVEELKNTLVISSLYGMMGLAVLSVSYIFYSQDLRGMYGLIPVAAFSALFAPYLVSEGIELMGRTTYKSIEKTLARSVTRHYAKESFEQNVPISEDPSILKNAAMLALVPAGIGALLVATGSVLLMAGSMYVDANREAVVRENKKSPAVAVEEEVEHHIPQDHDAAPYVLAMSALALYAGRKKKYVAERKITVDQEAFIEEVKSELGANHVNVYYGKNLKADGPRFLVTKKDLVLNGHRKFPAWAAALEYAAKGQKNYDLAGEIAKRNLGEK